MFSIMQTEANKAPGQQEIRHQNSLVSEPWTQFSMRMKNTKYLFSRKKHQSIRSVSTLYLFLVDYYLGVLHLLKCAGLFFL